MIENNQPSSGKRWLNDQLDLNVPSDLDYFNYLDEIIVDQLPSLYEALTGSERNNKYSIKNSNGLQIFFAVEETSYWMRKLLGSSRGFKIRILNAANQEAFRVTRHFKPCSGCCWFAGLCTHCAHELVIESPVGRPIGYVIQNSSFMKSSFDILDDTRTTILKIEGPWCTLDGPFCPVDNEFKVMDKEGLVQIGKITKNYSGLVKEAFTNADNFSISFPSNLYPTVKATLLGALFLIDFMFFEDKPGNKDK